MSIAGRRSHAGDEYQLRIATHWLVKLLQDDSIESVLVEAVSLPGDANIVAIDDIVITHKDGTTLFAQAKKNQTDHRAWNIPDPVLANELKAARDQLERNGRSLVIFYSRTPFGELAKLVQDAPAYSSYETFSSNAPTSLKDPLLALSNVFERSPEQTFGLIQRIQIGSHLDDPEWNHFNEGLLKSLTTNPVQSRRLFEEIIRRRQSGGSGAQSPIRRNDIVHALEAEGIHLSGTLDLARVREEFAQASAIGRNWPRTIYGETIPRPDIDALITSVREQRGGCILLTDGPGTGKTCVLLSFVEAMEKESGWDVLYIRGDEFAECSNDRDLVEHGLPDNFVAKSAALAQERRVLVVIDSLDVISMHGEHQSLRAFLKALDRLLRIANVTCVVACRVFDLTYDPLLRDREWNLKVSLKPLDFEANIKPLLEKLGIEVGLINHDLAKLLVIPRHLRLFVDIATSESNSAYWSTIRDDTYLYAHHLETMVRQDPMLGDAALQSLESVATQMVVQRSLFVHRSAVSLPERGLRRLISQGLLVEASGQTLRLGHQTLLDALVVRRAIAQSQSLLQFMRAHPPFPFIRPIVRAFVRHLHLLGKQIFGRQVREVFENGDVSYHLKRVVIESFAELEPTADDWPLVRYLYGAQQESFHRLLGAVRSIAWFDLLSEQWWPTLSSTSESEPSKARFIWVLDRWMNDRPAQVLVFWKSALDSTWRKANNIALILEVQLKNFVHWNIEGVHALLEDLLKRSSDDSYLGTPIAKFVEKTGSGLDLLWQFVTKDVEDDSLWLSHGRGLRCQDHHFHREGFLGDLLASSDDFLDIVLHTIDAHVHEGRAFESGTLHDTAWEDSHTEYDVRHTSDLRPLMDAVGEALRRRAASGDPSWSRFESRLRTTRNLGLRYLLLQTYLENVEGNVDGIAVQLMDEELIGHGRLEYELGELTNKAYPFLPAATQSQHQERLTRYHTELAQRYGDDASAARLIYDLLQPIPAILRTPASQQFLERWESCFGINPRRPHVVAWGGMVRAPITTEQILRLTPADLHRLLEHYEPPPERWELSNSGLVGGREELCHEIASAASRMPLEYLGLAGQWWKEGLYDGYIKAAIEGAADHLRYRFSNLVAPSGWTAGTPLPDSESIVGKILSRVEVYHTLWDDELRMARILDDCADAVTTLDNAERVAWLLFRLTRAKDPEIERVRINPHKRQQPETRDLLHDSMNTARGVAAGAAMSLACRLTELGVPFPELLAPMLKIFASDAVASVRAAILQSLPYFLQEHRDMGWDLLARTMADSNPHLWKVSESTLYYRLGSDFDRVLPYLRRMADAADVAGESWGRLTTLACLHGQIDLDTLFRELENRNVVNLWTGAAQVFVSNLDKESIAKLCRTGLLRILQRRPVVGSVVGLVDRHLRTDTSLDISDLVVAMLDAYDELSSRVDLFGIFEWIANAADRAPLETLPLLEKLIGSLEARLDEGRLLHSERLIATLLVILREVDQCGDEALVRRALSLQDAYLRLNVHGIEEMLNAASTRD